MTDPHETRLLRPLVELAGLAGERILSIYNASYTVSRKQDNSPLTDADMASHETILNGLAALTAGIPILSEESSTIPFARRRRWQTYWLVDPLDGTKEFIKRNGEFTVNIALIEAGSPVLGVVHVPAHGVTYAGCVGAGAIRHESTASPRPIHVSPLRGGPVRVVGSRSHRGELLDAYLAKLGPHELVPMGSALKFCLVAEGKADVYPRLGPTSEWDTAAAHAVLLAAGGHVVDAVAGTPLRYNQKESLLNPFFLAYGDDRRDWRQYLPALPPETA